jgi:hypothetical protein
MPLLVYQAVFHLDVFSKNITGAQVHQTILCDQVFRLSSLPAPGGPKSTMFNMNFLFWISRENTSN